MTTTRSCRARSAVRSLPAAMIEGATLKTYAGAPHGLTVTHQDRLNQDLLDFLKS